MQRAKSCRSRQAITLFVSVAESDGQVRSEQHGSTTRKGDARKGSYKSGFWGH